VGQEWKSVYLLNVADGCMPSDLGAGTSAEIEEERRLLYVAMTRAKNDLHLVVPQRFFVHASMRRAIAISMRQGQDSFQKSCSDYSSGRPGHLRRPVPRTHRWSGTTVGYWRPHARHVAIDERYGTTVCNLPSSRS